MKIKDKILSETSEEVKQRVRDIANKLVMKQETLEEYIDAKLYDGDITEDIAEAIRIGAKWQQERSYSEEDIKDAFQSGFTNGFNINSVTFEEWFEQFKKK